MFTVNWIINAHKILVTPIVLAMMWYFHNWSTAAFLYLGLHGTYTLLWVIKQSVFADKRFAKPIPLRIGLLTPFLPLMAYMIGPYLLISEHTVPPTWVFALAPLLCMSGAFLHFVSDAQKFFVLQLRKGLDSRRALRQNTESQLSRRSTDIRRIRARLMALAALRGACRLVRVLLPQHAQERRVDVSPSGVRCLQRSDGNVPAFAGHGFYAATICSAGFCNFARGLTPRQPLLFTSSRWESIVLPTLRIFGRLPNNEHIGHWAAISRTDRRCLGRSCRNPCTRSCGRRSADH